ncbi:MAG TPA: hypothetical protein VFG46_15200 [Chryseolinea sp.]|nr:hypothetical protein [Chryseolinea sp.]
MKKLIAIAFTCVYLLLTVGVINNTHYCMGRINPSVPTTGEKNISSHTDFAEKDSKNTPEFFILSDLYSEALVIFLA